MEWVASSVTLQAALVFVVAFFVFSATLRIVDRVTDFKDDEEREIVHVAAPPSRSPSYERRSPTASSSTDQRRVIRSTSSGPHLSADSRNDFGEHGRQRDHGDQHIRGARARGTECKTESTKISSGTRFLMRTLSVHSLASAVATGRAVRAKSAAPKHQCKRLDLSDSNLDWCDGHGRTDDREGSSKWSNFARSHYPKQCERSHVFKRGGAGKSNLSSMSVLSCDDQADVPKFCPEQDTCKHVHRQKARSVNVSKSKSNSSCISALLDNRNDVFDQRSQHSEQRTPPRNDSFVSKPSSIPRLTDVDMTRKDKGFRISCGSYGDVHWFPSDCSDVQDVDMWDSLSPGQQKLILGSLNDSDSEFGF